MKEIRSFNSSRSAVFLLYSHLVFVTKYRRSVFSRDHLVEMEAIFTSVCKELGAFLEEFDGEEDHVHLLVRYPPSVSVSLLAGRLKGASSKILKDIFPDLLVSWKKGTLWSPSYCAVSCGGASVDVVKKYIQNQCTPS
jgi:putative transposase